MHKHKMERWLLLVILMLAALLISEGAAETIQRSKTHLKSVGNRALYPIGEESFYFGISDYLSWDEARIKCNQLGMQLITLDTEERWTMISDWFIENMNSENTDSWWWTSGKKDFLQDTFIWTTTGENLTYSDWNVGQPNPSEPESYCINFNVARGGWDDDLRNLKLMYICENIPTIAYYSIDSSK